MKYANILTYLHGEAWAITPQALSAIHEIVELHATGQMTAEMIEARVAGTNYGISKIDGNRKGSTAVIPLHGTILNRSGDMQAMSGKTSPQSFAQAVKEAADDDSIKNIVLDIDSPGGTVSGTDLAAKAVKYAASKKNTISVANGSMASAAYWIGSQANKIVADPTASIGSIGVMLAHQDMSAKAEKEGVKVTYIRSSKDKAVGQSFEALSPDAAKKLQNRVDALNNVFVSTVASSRGVGEDIVRDQWSADVFVGQDALDSGLIDEIGSLDTVIESLSMGNTTMKKVTGAEAQDTIELGADAQDPIAAAEAALGITAADLADLRQVAADSQAAAAAAQAAAEASATELLATKVNALVAGAVSEGRALPSQIEKLTTKAMADFDFVSELLSEIPKGSITPANAEQLINGDASDDDLSGDALIAKILADQAVSADKPNLISIHRA